MLADVVLIVAGLLVGLIGTLVGAGGGFLLVPILLVFAPDEPPNVITGVSLSVVLVNSISGSVAYARQRRIDLRAGLALAVATIPGSILGALLTSKIDRDPFVAVFSVVLLAIAALIIFRPAPKLADPEVERKGWHRVVIDRSDRRFEYSFSFPAAFIACLGIGFFSSMLGIGGGIIQVPLFILAFGFPTHIATATSQFMLMIMALAGSSTHALQGSYSGEAIRWSLLLAPGVVVGAQIGARLARRMQPVTISRLLAAAMAVAALRLLWGVLG